MAHIHPTALVDSRAELADDVSIGAYSIIKGDVSIAAGSVVQEACHIHGHAIIGKNCKIGPSAFIGMAPQHLKFSGEGASVIVGDNVIVREMVTIHRPITAGLKHATRVGDRCMLMANSHVGHDAVVGNEVVLANAALLGGHVIVQENCFIGGGAAIHQWCRIGRLAIIGGNEAITRDVPPFGAAWYRGLKGYNAIGCRRARMPRNVIHAIRAAYHSIHTHRTMAAAIEEIGEATPLLPEIKEMLAFIAVSRRGVLHSVRSRGGLTRLYASVAESQADAEDAME